MGSVFKTKDRNLWSIREKYFLKILSWTTLLFFSITTIGWGISVDSGGLIQNFPHPLRINSKAEVALSDLLRGAGKIQESFFPSQEAPLVIHIQDAHCNYTAQKNIARIIRRLSKKYGIHDLLIEGAEGNVDIDFFKSYPDRGIKRKVFGHFLKTGELSGAEYLALTSQHAFKLSGLENKSLYGRNKEAFLAALKKRESVLKKLDGYEQELGSLKKRIYSQALQSLDSLQEAFEGGKNTFAEKWFQLQGVLKEQNISLETDYPQLSKFNQITRFPSGSDLNSLKRLEISLISSIKSKIKNQEELEAFVRQWIRHSRHQLSEASLKDYLLNQAGQLKISTESYRDFFNFLDYKNALGQIDGNKLFQELSRLEDNLKQKLLQNNLQREADLWTKRLKILKDLVQTEMTHEEWETYSKSSSQYSESSFLNFLGLNGSAYAKGEKQTLEDELAAARQFYQFAEQRDETFGRSIAQMVEKKKIKLLFFISGGFHTESLKKVLAQQFIGYVIIAPQAGIQKTRNNYLNLMQGKGELPSLNIQKLQDHPESRAGLSLFSPIQDAKDALALALVKQGQVGKWITNLRRMGKGQDVVLLQKIAGDSAVNDLQKKDPAFTSVGSKFLRRMVAHIIDILTGSNPSNNSQSEIGEMVADAFHSPNRYAPATARSLGDHTFFDDPIAGRGFLNYAYSLPGEAAVGISENIKPSFYEERIIASLPFRIVSKIEETDYFKMDGPAFIVLGYPFYSFWDGKGHVYITKYLADEIGFADRNDHQLTELVLSPKNDPDEAAGILKQLWLYWKVKKSLLNRPLTEMEAAFERKLPPTLPFAEELAATLAFLLEVARDPNQAFVKALEITGFPENLGLDLRHLPREEIQHLKELKNKIIKPELLQDLKRKMYLIPEWIRIYTEGSYDQLDQLAENPETTAAMLASFHVLLDRLDMDREASLMYDRKIRAWTEEMNEATQSWSVKEGLKTETPQSYLQRMLRKEPDEKGKLLILGMSWGWWENGNLRKLFKDLFQGKKLDSLIVPSSVEHLLPLYPEFDMTHIRFVRNPYQIRRQDAETIAPEIQNLVSQGKTAIMITGMEDAMKIAIHMDKRNSLYEFLLEEVFRGETNRISSVTYMDDTYGGDGHLLRGRRNVLLHALANESGLVAIPLERNLDLIIKDSLPGNHRQVVSFGALWNGILFQGKGSDEGSDQQFVEPSPPGHKIGLKLPDRKPVLAGASLGSPLPQITIDRAAGEAGNRVAELLKQNGIMEKLRSLHPGSWSSIRIVQRKSGDITVRVSGSTAVIEVPSHKGALQRFRDKLSGKTELSKKKADLELEDPDVNSLVNALIEQRSFIITSGSAGASLDTTNKIPIITALLNLKNGSALSQKIFTDLMEAVRQNLTSSGFQSDGSPLGDLSLGAIQLATNHPEQALQKILEDLRLGKLGTPLIKIAVPSYMKGVIKLIPAKFFTSRASGIEEKMSQKARDEKWEEMWKALYELNVISSIFDTEEWNNRLFKAVDKAVTLQFYHPFMNALEEPNTDKVKELLEENKTEVNYLKKNPPLKGNYAVLERNIADSLDLMIRIHEKVIELHEQILSDSTDLNALLAHLFEGLIETIRFWSTEGTQIPQQFPEPIRALLYYLAVLKIGNPEIYGKMVRSIPVEGDYQEVSNDVVIYEQILESLVHYPPLADFEREQWKKKKLDPLLKNLIPEMMATLWEYKLKDYESLFDEWDFRPLSNTLYELDVLAELRKQLGSRDDWYKKINVLKANFFEEFKNFQDSADSYLDSIEYAETQTKERGNAWDALPFYLKEQEDAIEIWKKGFENWEDDRFGNVETKYLDQRERFLKLLQADSLKKEFFRYMRETLQKSNNELKELVLFFENPTTQLEEKEWNAKKNSLLSLLSRVELTLDIWNPWLQMLKPSVAQKKVKQFDAFVESFNSLQERAQKIPASNLIMNTTKGQSLGGKEASWEEKIVSDLTTILTKLWGNQDQDELKNGHPQTDNLFHALSKPGNFITHDPKLPSLYLDSLTEALGPGYLEKLLDGSRAKKHDRKTAVIFDSQAIETLTLAEIETILKNEKSRIFIVIGRNLPAERRAAIRNIIDRKKVNPVLASRLSIVYSQDSSRTINDQLFELLTAQHLLPERITLVSPLERGFIGGINHIVYQGYLPGLALFAQALSMQEGNLENDLANIFSREGNHFVYSTKTLAEALSLEAKARTLQETAA